MNRATGHGYLYSVRGAAAVAVGSQVDQLAGLASCGIYTVITTGAAMEANARGLTDAWAKCEQEGSQVLACIQSNIETLRSEREKWKSANGNNQKLDSLYNKRMDFLTRQLSKQKKRLHDLGEGLECMKETQIYKEWYCDSPAFFCPLSFFRPLHAHSL